MILPINPRLAGNRASRYSCITLLLTRLAALKNARIVLARQSLRCVSGRFDFSDLVSNFSKLTQHSATQAQVDYCSISAESKGAQSS